jgi:hypothetical protein
MTHIFFAKFFYCFTRELNFLGAEKLFIKFLVFQSDKFLKTQLRLEQWQKSLAGTWQAEIRNIVWCGKWKENQPNF